MMEWIDALGVDWNLLGMAGVTFALVYLASVFGVATTGNAKRLAGGLAGVAVAAIRLYLLDLIPNEEVALFAFNAIVAWLGAAGIYTATEIAQAGYKSIKS